jgi:hypothetical protein
VLAGFVAPLPALFDRLPLVMQPDTPDPDLSGFVNYAIHGDIQRAIFFSSHSNYPE